MDHLLQVLVVAIMVVITVVDVLIIISLSDLAIGIVLTVHVDSKTLPRDILVSVVIRQILIKDSNNHSKHLNTHNILLINLAMVIHLNQ